ncbi:hypothetical protein [Methanoculleus sp. 7T]|uniref:hypothetical protein n=1 Tax=Methanoculleus sp. 7T TaxID=2937282 RepID=UPI0020C0E0D4|nr:hypothetical protein [Methanoculleus sp. 7T]MCK8517391.1 hypothetical protein [Methanoculleus sp. 7T]
MSEEICRAVELLAPDGGVVEVRALADGATHSGYFDDYAALTRAVEALDADPAVAGIYVTLNAVNPALLARRSNRIKMRLGRKDATTADADILRRRWLPVDIDPVRPSGVSSTDAEHDAALDAAERIAAYLAEQGFPEPLLADSGNGAHLLYRIDLPNDDAATELIKGALATLDALFSNETVTVDTANYNAARIWKLYGTLSRKGDNTPERPHRRAKVLGVPAQIDVVPVERLEHLAGLLPRNEPPKKAGSIDLAAWLAEHGIAVRSTRPWQGGTLFSLNECPFSSAHKDGAFAIQFANGAIFAGCHHQSCGGGAQRWPELRGMYEPKRTQKREEKPAPPPDEHRERALAILRDGDPLAFFLDTFNQSHVGDRTVAECLAKVEDIGDDQVMNRMLTVWIDDSAEQDARVLDHMKEAEAAGRGPAKGDILTCRAIWEAVKGEVLPVRIPFARRIQFSATRNRRNPGMLFDLIKCRARLFFLQRDRDGDGAVVARPEDFTAAAKLYGALSGTVGSQETKLTKNEAAALATVARMGVEVFTVRGLQAAMGLSYQKTRRLLNGYVSRGTPYSGLLEKCPAISLYDATVTEDGGCGVTVRRREQYFTFDNEVYRAWSGGTSVWLDDDPDDDSNDSRFQQNDSNYCHSAVTCCHSPPPVNPADYIALPEPKDEPCHVCGRRPTSSVKRGGGKYLCYECLKKAKRPAKVRPLPGVLDHRGFERVKTDLGRCDVCGEKKAVYRSREARAKVCEGCYARLVREWNTKEGIR